jgi:hypothetical protein
MAAMSNSQRVEKYRVNLRMLGLRPVQIWVPDTRKIGFENECARQSKIVNSADLKDIELDDFLDMASNDIEGWTT